MIIPIARYTRIVGEWCVPESIPIGVTPRIVTPIVTTQVWSTNYVHSRCLGDIPNIVLPIIIGVVGVVVEIIVINDVVVAGRRQTDAAVRVRAYIVLYDIVVVAVRYQVDTMNIV